MTAAVRLRDMLREARGLGARAAFFVACLAVGVAAVTAVAGLATSLERALRADARQLLAADVAVEGRAEIPPDLDQIIASVPGALRTDVTLTATVVSARVPHASQGDVNASQGDLHPSQRDIPASQDDPPGRSLLVQLKAIGEDYPFYGVPVVAPQRRIQELVAGDGAVVAPEALAKLGIGVGDRLRIGDGEFRVTGTVSSEPDRLDVGFSLGPRVFVSHAGLDRAGLVGFGSRITHRALIRLPDGSGAAAARRLAERIRAELPDADYYEVETFAEAQPGLRDSLRRAERFLGLVALVSLLLGGIGVGQTVRAWIGSRLDSIAVRKVLGMRPREIVWLYLGQTAALGLAGSLVGAAAGTVVLALAPAALAGLVPASAVSAWQPLAIARGLVLGLCVAILFALPPLLRVRRVPPLRVLRRDLEPIASGPLARATLATILVAGVFGTAWTQSGSIRLGAGFTIGLAAAVGVLALASFGLARLVGRAARRAWRVSLRYGLAAAARPGADTLGSMTALGLGTLVVLAMHLVQHRLEGSLRAELPEGAPSVFFADIQPGQWPEFSRSLEAAGATSVRMSPLVRARLAAVDGTPVRELAQRGQDEGEERRREWALTREQNLTYADELPDDNRLVAGRWWNDPNRAEVSVEREFAREIGASVGSTLRFDLQGVPIEATVAGIREIEWGTFRPNFFLVFEPGVLENAPQFRVAAARLPTGREQEIQDRLAGAFPNVVAIPVREILEKVASVLERAGRGVRYLGAFTVLAGVAILLGAVSAGSARRTREVALLRTLGMTRAGVATVLTVEYVLVGFVAGAVGAAGAGILAWAVVTQGMDLGWAFDVGPYALAVLGTMMLTAVAGVVASWPALSRPPLQALR